MELLEQVEKQSAKVSVVDAIYHRRSVRAYVPKKVNEPTVRALIDAAIHAPSAGNAQPWAFAVVQDVAMLKRISDQAKQRLASDPYWKLHTAHASPFTDPDFDIFYGASTLIVVCAKKDDFHGFSAAQDCFLAAQNLMLAAYAMGLGTCPIGFARDVLHTDAWTEALSVAADYRPVLPIIVGFPDEAAHTVKRTPARIFSWKA